MGKFLRHLPIGAFMLAVLAQVVAGLMLMIVPVWGTMMVA